MFIEVGVPNLSFNVYSPLLKKAFLHTRLSPNPCPPKNHNAIIGTTSFYEERQHYFESSSQP